LVQNLIPKDINLYEVCFLDILLLSFGHFAQLDVDLGGDGKRVQHELKEESAAISYSCSGILRLIVVGAPDKVSNKVTG
jgi:hypothetical protein